MRRGQDGRRPEKEWPERTEERADWTWEQKGEGTGQEMKVEKEKR